MTPPPGPQEAAAVPGAAPATRRPLFGSCWSCRVISGLGLLAAAAWIYRGPRTSMKRGVPPSMAAITQITFALGQ
ncbi:DMAC1 protein, partial [Urocolius indicus]|nr:DMAC1 protein [Urocolius indicus]